MVIFKIMSIFSKIKLSLPRRSVHDLSYASKLSLPFGRLVPILCEKIVPGDKFRLSTEFLMRFAPFIGQLYQGYDVRCEYYFVPSRLLWNNFSNFLTDGIDGTDNTYLHPYLTLKDVSYMTDDQGNVHNIDLVNTVIDYLNLPTEFNYSGQKEYPAWSDINAADTNVDALPFYALYLTYLQYYLDENLDLDYVLQSYLTSQVFDLAHDGDNTSKIAALFGTLNGLTPPISYNDMPYALMPFLRAYPKDYFTSALPWAQRGPQVTIPLNGSGQVRVMADGQGHLYQGVGVRFSDPSQVNQEVELFNYGYALAHSDGANFDSQYGEQESTLAQAIVDIQKGVESIRFEAVNINGVATISDLRTAMAVQNWLEKRARTGARPKEQIAASFGVISKDYRLDRPELLMATKNTVNVGEIFTTNADKSSTFVPGLGISTASATGVSRQMSRFFEEHGYLIAFMSVMPRAAYYQGIPRQFLELDKYDYYWPEFQHIGEQPIYNKELFLRDDNNNPYHTNNDVFGYTPRYAHYKSRTNQVHGNFRTNLNFMHAGRVWSETVGVPNLNNAFVYYNEDVNDQLRMFNNVTPYVNAVPIQAELYHHIRALRPMSYFGSPRLV